MSTTATLRRRPSGPVATPAQLALLEKLCTEREVVYTPQRLAELTKSQASAVISNLLSKQATAKTAKRAEPGYYAVDGKIFVVTANQAGTSTYAKVLTVSPNGGRGSWSYAPGVVSDLAFLQPLSVEEAAALGREHGVCVICGRELSDPESVARGIGPVCAKRL